MLLIICIARKISSHWQPLFSKKMAAPRRRPHFPTKLAAAASFSYKIGGGGLIFLQNWRRRQGFGNITGGVLTWSEYWDGTNSTIHAGLNPILAAQNN